MTSDERAARRMQWFRGVRSVVNPIPSDLRQFAALIDEHLLTTDRAAPGDECIVAAPTHIGQEEVPRRIVLHRVGDAV